MFKSLHSTLQKAQTPEFSPKHPDVTLIHSADLLLNTEKRQQFLSQIKSLLNLPPKLYDTLYYQVIKNFAEFTQNLPETQYGLFSNEGGFLDHSLERAARALSLCLNYFFPQEKTLQAVSPQEALWIYAVFTAALLLDAGKIAVKYDLEICNKDGSLIKSWNPYTGPMTKYGKYYNFNFVKRNFDQLKRLVTSLLARQILDQSSDDSGENGGVSGFNWISSNPDVLETWLTILQGERRLPMTSFMSVIPIAEAQIIANYFANKPITHPTHNYNLFETTPEGIELAENFLRWLREKLASGVTSVNNPSSDVHVAEDNVLISEKLFEQYLHDTNSAALKNVTTDQLIQQFLKMLEQQWDLPTAQNRYTVMQQVNRFIGVGNREILFAPDFQANLSPYVRQALLQTPNAPLQQPLKNNEQKSVMTPPVFHV